MYVTDVPNERRVLIALGEELQVIGSGQNMTLIQQVYVERILRQRPHQPLFRAQVMHAWERPCEVCLRPNILGLSPGYVVHVNSALMPKVDGPMLRYGIQAMDKQATHVPRRLYGRPAKGRLAARFGEFLHAS